jgi:hypothetical protein
LERGRVGADYVQPMLIGAALLFNDAQKSAVRRKPVAISWPKSHFVFEKKRLETGGKETVKRS